jgi:hypothetical protein
MPLDEVVVVTLEFLGFLALAGSSDAQKLAFRSVILRLRVLNAEVHGLLDSPFFHSVSIVVDFSEEAAIEILLGNRSFPI